MAVVIVLGFAQRAALAIAFVLYLSLVHIGQTFLGYQWDYLLLETGFLAIFFGHSGVMQKTIAWLYRWLAERGYTDLPAKDVSDFICWAAVFGVMLGGRLGWVLFYGLETVIRQPLRLFRIWEGGMSVHGGVIGVIIAMSIFGYTRRRAMGDVYDFVAPLPSIGFMMGRIGNFINGELWGKPTTLPWGFNVNGQVRHPSQLYEALLEGLVLFFIVWWFSSRPRPRLATSGVFLLGYGIARFFLEFVRLPDEHIGYLAGGWLTMGQVLSFPMIITGIVFLLYAYRVRTPSGNVAIAQ